MFPLLLRNDTTLRRGHSHTRTVVERQRMLLSYQRFAMSHSGDILIKKYLLIKKDFIRLTTSGSKKQVTRLAAPITGAKKQKMSETFSPLSRVQSLLPKMKSAGSSSEQRLFIEFRFHSSVVFIYPQMR